MELPSKSNDEFYKIQNLYVIMKKYLYLIIALFFLASCESNKSPFDFDKIKTELKLDEVQVEKFDAIVKKYDGERKAIMSGQGESTLKRIKMKAVLESQLSDTRALLSDEQNELFKPIATKFKKFGSPGYSQELMIELKTELALDSTKYVMLEMVNKSFEKSYIDAHDYYHGNPEAAKEYWGKFDTERKKVLKSVFDDSEYAMFEKLTAKEIFEGEHGGN